ncbi:MAG: hypothetical protein ACR2N0_17800 [Rubrobacteraceae bacterium]|jgi:hypothetical protein|nr:hypothetical protein [Rubrobacter sp.]
MAKIELRQAIERAFEEIRKIYDEKELNDLLLEEIERSNDTWFVTVGFTRFARIPPFAKAMGQRYVADPNLRDYKEIKLDAQTGEFKSMRDRRLEEYTRL